MYDKNLITARGFENVEFDEIKTLKVGLNGHEEKFKRFTADMDGTLYEFYFGLYADHYKFFADVKREFHTKLKFF